MAAGARASHPTCNNDIEMDVLRKSQTSISVKLSIFATTKSASEQQVDPRTTIAIDEKTRVLEISLRNTMNESQARKELQEIFLKGLTLGKSVPWKPLNRAVILLKRFPQLASERFMAKRNRGNKPRYPLFMLAEHGGKLKHHIKPVHDLFPKALSEERQVYGQDRKPESLLILNYLDFDVLLFLVDECPYFALDMDRCGRCILDILFQRKCSPAEEVKISGLVEKVRPLLIDDEMMDSIFQKAVWSSEPVVQTKNILRFLRCSKTVRIYGVKSLTLEHATAIGLLLPRVDRILIDPFLGYEAKAFKSLAASLTSCRTLQSIQLESLGFMRLGASALEALEVMLRECSLGSLQALTLDFGSKGNEGYRPWDNEGCDLALKSIEKGLARRKRPLEYLEIRQATVKAPGTIPTLLEAAQKKVYELDLEELLMTLNSTGAETLESSWESMPERVESMPERVNSVRSRLRCMLFGFHHGNAADGSSTFFHQLELALPRIQTMRTIVSTPSRIDGFAHYNKKFVGSSALVKLLSKMPQLEVVKLPNIQVDLSKLADVLLKHEWKVFHVAMSENEEHSPAVAQIECLANALESGGNKSLNICTIPKPEKQNIFERARIDSAMKKIDYWTSLNYLGRHKAGNPITNVSTLVDMIERVERGWWTINAKKRKENYILGLIYGLLRENPTIWCITKEDSLIGMSVVDEKNLS